MTDLTTSLVGSLKKKREVKENLKKICQNMKFILMKKIYLSNVSFVEILSNTQLSQSKYTSLEKLMVYCSH